MEIKILKSDGNGGHVVNLPVAVVAVIVTIIVSLLPAVFAYGALNEKVDQLEQSWDEELPKQVKASEDLTSRIVELEKIAASTGTSIPIIQKDIDLIKKDLKDLLYETREGNK